MHIHCIRCMFRTTEHCKISEVLTVNMLKYGADFRHVTAPADLLIAASQV